MKNDTKLTLLRSIICLLILAAEMILTGKFLSVRPLYIPPQAVIISWYGIIPAAVICYLFSTIYAKYRAGAHRIRIAAWVGICWPLPVTLIAACFSPTGFQYSVAECIMQHFTLPLLCVLPTLVFILTEPGPPPHTLKPLRPIRHILYALAVIASICLLLYTVCGHKILTEQELKQSLSIRGKLIDETDDYYVVDINVINLTDSPIVLGNTTQSLVDTELLTATYNSETPAEYARLTGFPVLYTQEIRPTDAESFRILFRKTPQTVTPDTVILSFTHLSIGGRTYTRQVFQLTGNISRLR